MKFTYLASVSAAAFFALSTVAMAADAVVYEPAPDASVIPVFSWTGAYIGLNAGYGGGKAEHPFSITDTTTVPATTLLSGGLDFNSSGFVGGAQVGYNYQIDQFVLGVEADIQGANVKGEGSLTLTDNLGNVLDARLGTKLDWYGTVRARVGVAATDRFLVYATGGLAYGRTTSYARGTLGGATFDESAKETKTGWTVGAGAEYAVTNNVTFKTEYLYTDLGKANLYSDELIPGINANLDREFNFHTVRVGINYKF